MLELFTGIVLGVGAGVSLVALLAYYRSSIPQAVYSLAGLAGRCCGWTIFLIARIRNAASCPTCSVWGRFLQPCLAIVWDCCLGPTLNFFTGCLARRRR